VAPFPYREQRFRPASAYSADHLFRGPLRFRNISLFGLLPIKRSDGTHLATENELKTGPIP
jgi:hypothetical protein